MAKALDFDVLGCEGQLAYVCKVSITQMKPFTGIQDLICRRLFRLIHMSPMVTESWEFGDIPYMKIIV